MNFTDRFSDKDKYSKNFQSGYLELLPDYLPTMRGFPELNPLEFTDEDKCIVEDVEAASCAKKLKKRRLTKMEAVQTTYQMLFVQNLFAEHVTRVREQKRSFRSRVVRDMKKIDLRKLREYRKAVLEERIQSMWDEEREFMEKMELAKKNNFDVPIAAPVAEEGEEKEEEVQVVSPDGADDAFERSIVEDCSASIDDLFNLSRNYVGYLKIVNSAERFGHFGRRQVHAQLHPGILDKELAEAKHELYRVARQKRAASREVSPFTEAFSPIELQSAQDPDMSLYCHMCSERDVCRCADSDNEYSSSDS